MIQHTRSMIAAGVKVIQRNTTTRGFARMRRDAPKNPNSEASLAAAAAKLSAAVKVDPVQSAFISKATKIISDMSANSSSTYIKGGEIEENNSWNWVPPRDGEREDNEIIPVKKGVLLTTEEIKEALIAQGGIDVVVVEMREPIETLTHLVVTSGRSTKHIRKMSDSIVQALKSRKLKQAMGQKGAEGAKDDDWLCVDCYDSVVHFMLPSTRKALDLEKHWTEERPILEFTSNERAYDQRFEDILEHYPIPEDYQVPRKDEKVEVSKKQKVTIRRL